MEDKQHYTLYEVSMMTRIHLQTLYSRIKSSGVKPILIKGFMHFSKEDIEKLSVPLKIGRPKKNAQGKQVKPN